MSSAQTDFYLSVPTFDDFSNVADMSVYVPLPADWLVGMTDVVGSTAAISAGRGNIRNAAGGSRRRGRRPVENGAMGD